MKAYQLKILLKNSKPPVWRRCRIPAGITFSQLALILEHITESGACAEYEYEFYQAGIQVREWQGETGRAASFRYDCLCASDTFIDGLADQEEWFTFRPGDGRQYRVEIEERREEPICCPVVVKQKAAPQGPGWSDLETVNGELSQRCPLQWGEPDYRTFAELAEESKEGKYGITVACRPEDRTERRQVSAESKMRTFANTVMQEYVDAITEKIMGEHKGTGEGEMMDADALQDLLEKAEWQIKRDIREKMLGRDMREGHSRHPGVKEFLMGETKSTLLEMAADLKLSRCKSLSKDSLAEKIREELLKPEVMQRRMLLLGDEEIQVFEKAMARKGGFYPDREEMEHLEKLYDLTYVLLYSDDYAEVPKEVEEVYRQFNTPAFQEKRRETFWLYHCLQMVDMLCGSAPVSVVCRMLKKCLRRKVERKNVEEFWANLPEELNPCVLRGEKVISRELLRDSLYLRVEEMQGKGEFYIPDPDEILEYTENGYPVSDPNYRRLKTFLVRGMNMGIETADEYMPVVWSHISMGAAPADIMEILEREEFVFSKEEDLREFVSILMDVNNHTRMMINRGWTPMEMREKLPPLPRGKRPTIVPMSSEAARLLGEATGELKNMGFDVDLNQSADEIPTISMPDGISGKIAAGTKKVYPNDPCPCGSGKKYKKCCGRK